MPTCMSLEQKKNRANHKSPLHKIIALRDEMKFSEVLFLPLPKHTHTGLEETTQILCSKLFSA